MTEPNEFELLELATPYALNAISDSERAAIDRQLAAAPAPVAAAFTDEVRAVRETMAGSRRPPPLSHRTGLRAAVLAGAPPTRPADLVGARPYWLRPRRSWWHWPPSAPESRCDQRPHRPWPSRSWQHRMCERSPADVAGGTATVVFSRDMNAGMLVMNNVPPPSQGTVYEMWLVGDKGPVSAGTMDTAAVTPSTTHMLTDLGHSSVLAFTVEPGTGSPQPTGKIFAKLSLT